MMIQRNSKEMLFELSVSNMDKRILTLSTFQPIFFISIADHNLY